MAVDVWLLLPFILAGAALYTSVGHGGATVYLAILALAGYALGPLVTTVLVLNILAAGIAFVAFRQAGHLRPRLLLPFAATSIPAAFLGGLLRLPLSWQEAAIGVALLAAAARFLLLPTPAGPVLPAEGARFTVLALALGAALGFLAGLTGIGGGIFLSPVLVALGWADVRESAAVASAFIVLNSAAGLTAKVTHTPLDVALLLPLGATVLAGAAVGSLLGAKKLPPRALQILLGVVLLAGALRAFV